MNSRGLPLDRPFDPVVWEQAKTIVAQYHMVFEPIPEGGYLGRSFELPYAMADGETIPVCAESLLESQTLAVATMLENGEQPPLPWQEVQRTEQVNVRLNPFEKTAIDHAAKRAGFRSVSDYIRTAALRGTD